MQARGKAAEHECVDCGNQAHDWSYKLPKGFSFDADDYEPRSRSCHLYYDKALA